MKKLWLLVCAGVLFTAPALAQTAKRQQTRVPKPPAQNQVLVDQPAIAQEPVGQDTAAAMLIDQVVGHDPDPLIRLEMRRTAAFAIGGSD